METRVHWESVYQHKAADKLSWYAPHLRLSLRYIRAAAPDKGSSIIDIGAGASTLVDDLLDDGYTNVTLLDIAESAFEVTRRRLDERATQVRWIVGDATKVTLPARGYDVWHDRAVFHFLTRDDDRERYVAQLRHALASSGHVVLGTFGPEGPPRCSGLVVSRYSPDQLQRVFGNGFALLDSSVEEHTTPNGSKQQFVYCHFRRSSTRP